MSPVLFCHTLKCVWHCSPPIKGTQIFLRSGVVCSEVAARKEGAAGTNPSRLKDEPKRGFISIRFFRCKASFKVSFSSGEDGLILCYRFSKRTDCPFTRKRCAMKGFFSVHFFRQRQARHKSNDNLTEWLTTIEQ